MGFHIRDMDKKDIKAVQNVARESWKSTYNGIIPMEIQETFLGSAYSDGMMHKRLEVSSLYVAEVSGEVVGFANFSTVKQGNIAELGAIYLLSEYQGEGIGTALLREGIKNLNGAQSLIADVEKENKSGLTFYKAKGFHIHSEFNDNLDGLITKMARMVLPIQ
ncbi:GNAT family N-acetyltransferase [Planococcus koreensis]|uniref:GNAT family N-acetyltransferase n=1 Tax=Planococcus koreensis TaxID=112331 RepID=UPI0039FCD637